MFAMAQEYVLTAVEPGNALFATGVDYAHHAVALENVITAMVQDASTATTQESAAYAMGPDSAQHAMELDFVLNAVVVVNVQTAKVQESARFATGVVFVRNVMELELWILWRKYVQDATAGGIYNGDCGICYCRDSSYRG